MKRYLALYAFALFAMLAMGLSSAALAARLTVDLGDAKGVTMVGAIDRWDMDGNHRTPVDKDAKIESPPVDAKAKDMGNGQWVFDDLKPGKYDLVIIAEGRVRVEGFVYVPVREFDPFIKSDAVPEEDAIEWIVEDIKAGRHYENKVEPLCWAGDDKAIRVLVMLIRDQATSYTAGAGTMRHEIWQYTWNYGGWQKEKRTKVLDRVLLQVSDLRQWTWLWDTKLGGIEVKKDPVSIKYQMPSKTGERKLKGLYPY
jgi:hypothetical protein